jgi:hypothetical protein
MLLLTSLLVFGQTDTKSDLKFEFSYLQDKRDTVFLMLKQGSSILLISRFTFFLNHATDWIITFPRRASMCI